MQTAEPETDQAVDDPAVDDPSGGMLLAAAKTARGLGSPVRVILPRAPGSVARAREAARLAGVAIEANLQPDRVTFRFSRAPAPRPPADAARPGARSVAAEAEAEAEAEVEVEVAREGSVVRAARA